MYFLFSLEFPRVPIPERVAMRVPLVQQGGESLAEEVGQRDHFLEWGAAFGWSVGQ